MKLHVLVILILMSVIWNSPCLLRADNLPQTWGPYYSPDKMLQINLVFGSASLSYAGSSKPIEEITLEDFCPDYQIESQSIQPPKVEWSPNGHFFLISGNSGAHGQYSFSLVYRIVDASAGPYHALAVERITLLDKLGQIISVDPESHSDTGWAFAGITFTKTGIDATYAPVGHNSHQFDNDGISYVLHLKETSGRALTVESIERDVEESQNHFERKIVFRN